MNKNDVKIGMKVIPNAKSFGSSLDICKSYTKMMQKPIEARFLYVTHQHVLDVEHGIYQLSDDINDIGQCGDHFKSEDFEPYTED